jgi:hypothetical protein
MKKYFSSKDSRYVNEEKPSPRFSYGNAVPKSGGFQACLCPDPDNITYSKKCCKGYLYNQGVGRIAAVYPSGSNP